MILYRTEMCLRHFTFLPNNSSFHDHYKSHSPVTKLEQETASNGRESLSLSQLKIWLQIDLLSVVVLLFFYLTHVQENAMADAHSFDVTQTLIPPRLESFPPFSSNLSISEVYSRLVLQLPAACLYAVYLWNINISNTSISSN